MLTQTKGNVGVSVLKRRICAIIILRVFFTKIVSSNTNPTFMFQHN